MSAARRTGSHPMQAEPMGEPHGPGWSINTGPVLYQLWAPNARRPYWAAAWTHTDGACGHAQAASSGEAVTVFEGCPRRKEALAAAMQLLAAAYRAGAATPPARRNQANGEA